MRPKETEPKRDEKQDLLSMFTHLAKTKKGQKLSNDKAQQKETTATKREYAKDEIGIWNLEKDTDLESFIMG